MPEGGDRLTKDILVTIFAGQRSGETQEPIGYRKYPSPWV